MYLEEVGGVCVGGGVSCGVVVVNSVGVRGGGKWGLCGAVGGAGSGVI